MASLMPNAKQQYSNNAGAPLSGGKIYTYAAGTTTPKATYTTAAGDTENANPVVLNARGEAAIYWDGSYFIEVKDASDVLVYSADNYTEPASLVTALRADLAASSGASRVGYQQGGVGAEDRTVQDRLRDFVSAADFGFLPSASASENKTALVAAIAALGSTGGEIYIPKGVYNCDPGISIVSTQKNITLTGSGSAMGYEPGAAGTRIVFTVGSIGFDLTSLSSAGNYTLLRNIGIDGNSVLETGIKIEGQQLLDHVDVTGCTNAGIWLFDNVNQTALNHVSSSYNTDGYGLLVGGTGNTGLNTVFSATHCNFRRNLVGVRIEQCVRPKFTICVIESNTHEGVQIYKGASQCEYIEFDTCWIENNWSDGTATDYNVTIDSATHDFSSGPPGYIRFINCMFYSATSASAINIISAFVAELDHCGGAGAVDLGTYATGVHFKDWNGGTITDAGNRNWQSSTNRSGSEGGGPLFPTAYANRLTVLGTGTTTSCPNGTATTCYTMPSSSGMRYYQVFAKIAIGTADATSFSAYAMIAADSTSKLLSSVDGTNLSISVSGLDIKVTQVSGATNPVEVAVLPVFPVI